MKPAHTTALFPATFARVPGGFWFVSRPEVGLDSPGAWEAGVRSSARGRDLSRVRRLRAGSGLAAFQLCDSRWGRLTTVSLGFSNTGMGSIP